MQTKMDHRARRADLEDYIQWITLPEEVRAIIRARFEERVKAEFDIGDGQ
jgi:hypothetical protein